MMVIYNTQYNIYNDAIAVDYADNSILINADNSKWYDLEVLPFLR